MTLFMSFWLTVSEEKLLSWTRFHVRRSLPRQVTVTIETLQTRFWGFELGQVTLRDTNQQRDWLKIDTVKVRFNVIALVFSQELPFEFNLYGGNGSGTIGYLPNSLIKLRVSNMELNWVPAIRRTQIIKSNPTLELEGKFAPDTRIGNIQFQVRNIKMSGDKARTNLSVNLPDTDLANIRADLKFNRKQVEMTIDTTGDVEAHVEGRVYGDLGRIKRAKADLKLNARIKKTYQAQLGIFNSILNNYRSKNGRISIHLTGKLSAPQIKKF